MFFGLASWEAWLQHEENAFVRQTAWRIVREANANDPRARVLALRNYLRDHVRYQDAPSDDTRPFLRATAAETIASGRGYCGEVSRAFINLSYAVGIPAQRINLYGRHMHVVAEVELKPFERLVVDAQNPPSIADLEPIEHVILRPEYDDYYTLNLRRLHLSWLISRARFEMGALTRWAENPHMLKGTLWMSAAVLLVMGAALRKLLRIFLLRRGWVHRSTLGEGGTAAPVGRPA